MNKFSHIELDEKELVTKTLKYIYSIENTYLECSLFINILNPLEKYEALKFHETFLIERLSKLKFIVDYDEVNFDNKIKGFSDHTFEQTRKLGDKMFAIEKFSKEIFWANEQEQESYRVISHFNCYQEQIVPDSKMYNVLSKGDFFNVNAWIQYYQNLLDLKFSEFSEKMVFGKTIIKYKPFMGIYFLGIETDYRSCKDNFKKGNWEEPNYKLIIFKKNAAKTIEKVVTFIKFAHPHFNPPAYSFGWYSYAENTIQVSDKELSLKYIVDKEFLDDGMVKLSMSEVFGEYLKRHAYFYYDMLYHTTKEYIKFIEESFDPENE